MSVSDNNKRIAKNTLFLYFRMIVIILVNLFTVRVVLAELGETDYGIYNVIGGVVVMFSFISSCMTTATQRYLTFELGRENHDRLAKVFSISLLVHIAIALAIVLLAETVGLWFVNTQMTLPASEMSAANWVYQLSILAFCVNIIQVPYDASLIAHEKMNVFAYISFLEAALKVAIAYALVVIASDKLIWYAFLVLAMRVTIRLIYQIYCRRNFAECRFRMVRDSKLFKEMTTFAGWNLLGSVAWLMKGQGLNIILNMFFGPVINAAQALAVQVRQAVTGFVFNFMSAVNPQITKYYASGQRTEMENLAYNGLKYSFMLLLFLSLPVMLDVRFILGIWLEEVPDYTALFVILVLTDSLCNSIFDQPLMTSIAATGNIRSYQIVVSVVMLLIGPVAYAALKFGAPPQSVYYVSIIITVIAGLLRFHFCRVQLDYSWQLFTDRVLLPAFRTVLLALPLPLALRLWVIPDTNWLNAICVFVATIVCEGLAIWFVGLSAAERSTVCAIVKKRISKKQ